MVLRGKKNRRKFIDHINHKGLDNRKENLRVVTHGQNLWNSRLSKRNKSGAKGVCWHWPTKKWQATIRKNNILKHLGYYKTVAEAKAAYDKAAQMLFGEYWCQG
jgi:hypothetical protein